MIIQVLFAYYLLTIKAITAYVLMLNEFKSGVKYAKQIKQFFYIKVLNLTIMDFKI